MGLDRRRGDPAVHRQPCPDLARAGGAIGMFVPAETPRAFDAQIEKEIANNAGLVKAAGIPIAQ